MACVRLPREEHRPRLVRGDFEIGVEFQEVGKEQMKLLVDLGLKPDNSDKK